MLSCAVTSKTSNLSLWICMQKLNMQIANIFPDSCINTTHTHWHHAFGIGVCGKVKWFNIFNSKCAALNQNLIPYEYQEALWNIFKRSYLLPILVKPYLTNANALHPKSIHILWSYMSSLVTLQMRYTCVFYNTQSEWTLKGSVIIYSPNRYKQRERYLEKCL